MLDTETQFCNSNDINYKRRSRKNKHSDSNKKSFYDFPKKGRKKKANAELFSYKSKKYTQSYDSNQLNFKFKTKKRQEDMKSKPSGASPRKISVIHDGRNF
jgi:hypothetical protein